MQSEPDINIGGNPSPTILGMTRVEFFKELNARSHQKFEARQKATSWDTDELWAIAAKRPIPTVAPIVKASDLVRNFGYIKPCGPLPVPEFLWPCWLVKETFRHWSALYMLFAWCDECQKWDRYGGDSQWAADIITGGTLEARCPHHRGQIPDDGTDEVQNKRSKHAQHAGNIFTRFFGFYNFGAAPDEIQKIFKKSKTTLKGSRIPPPEHLRRIQVVNDIEAA